MILIDTSSWIETLRVRGDDGVRARVRKYVLDGEAAWCPIIRLELWHGVRGDVEKRDLRQLESLIIELPIDDLAWSKGIKLAMAARQAGLSVPSPDLIVVATALRHSVAVEHCDRHIERLLKLA